MNFDSFQSDLILDRTNNKEKEIRQFFFREKGF